ncbi:hypothetical protein BC937DRAFT_93814 [Endogone sp. FLAS-F59071]|nr:hypothetical protein BC937DRAFT_93814 [Endogone sp. FLAS-F59071]|eukprot:RUS14448.1 hypothetical protein BC937DRAFT_93814 [Endogone sp. FLAS-F59071]
MSNSKAKDQLFSPISQGSVPWPHRFQVSEFPPSDPSSDAVRITRAFARAAGEQLGFEETSDLNGAVILSMLAMVRREPSSNTW